MEGGRTIQSLVTFLLLLIEWGIIVVVGEAHKRWDVHEGLAMAE
jgi:hypothetical protein